MKVGYNMPTLTMFTVCNSIGDLNPQPGVSIPTLNGPQAVLRPLFIPSSFSFGISAGVIGIDLTKPNSIRFVITNPDKKIIQDSGESGFPALPEGDSLPIEYQGFMLTLDIRNLVIEKEGVYVFELYVNGVSAGAREIPIFAAKRQ